MISAGGNATRDQKSGSDCDASVLLSVENLVKDYPAGTRGLGMGRQLLRAVDNVSIQILSGETFGLVGESGCGKTTVARCVMRLTDPTSGHVWFDGTNVTDLRGTKLRKIRRRMQIMFQDSHASLDTRMTARQIVEEPLIIHGLGNAASRRRRVDEVLSLVGIDPLHGSRKPHGFSGGQAQRIALARSLVLNPELLVLDEPVSALDVSIQAQVLNFLRDIQQRFSLTYLFIVHDLVVAEYFCDRIAVLYLGSVMEIADSGTLFRNPQHPYTVSLVSAVPVPDPDKSRRRQRIVLTGEVSQTGESHSGCRFRSRCPVGQTRSLCKDVSPALAELSSGHLVACHYPGELNASAGEPEQFRHRSPVHP